MSTTVNAPAVPASTPAAPSQGRGWAYLGVLLGGAVSIAANIAHSYVPPTAVTEAGPATVEAWQPHPGAVIGAVFWPVALFIALEIFARISWPQSRRWTMLRFGGLLPVALVAAIVSYRHLSGLLHFYSEDPLTTVIGPLAVDGLMIMASGALIATSHHTMSGQDGPPNDQDDQDDQDGPAPADPVTSDGQDDAAGLLDQARRVAAAHLAAHGRPITRDQLRARLRTSTDTATVLHRQIRSNRQDQQDRQDERQDQQDRRDRPEDGQDGQDRSEVDQGTVSQDRPGLLPIPADTFTRTNGTPRDIGGRR